MRRDVHSVGVDLGGTWVRAYASDKSGRRLKYLKASSPPRKTLPRFLLRLWRYWRIQDLKFLTVGSRGVWLLKDRKALQRSLKGLAERVRVVSDVELAFESALTPANTPPGRAAGILILAGTGSIALGRDARGRVARAGGLGPAKGDEGSGYWIGREYARRVLSGRRMNNRSVAEIAALAETVLQKARRDRACREIRSEAQTHLSGLVLTLARRLNFRGRITVSWAGSLMGNADFRRGFFQALRKDKSFEFKIVPPKNDPASAAARWAGKLQGFPSAFLSRR